MTLAASQPLRPDPRARFWNKIAVRYAATPVEDVVAYERKLQMTRDVLAPHMVALELGCGTGTTALWHAPTVAHIRAVDASPSMLAIAQEKAAVAGVENVSFEVAAVEDMAEAPGAFDVVMAMSLLHLVPDRDEAIARVMRWLKPGGVFVSSTPCVREIMPAFALIAPFGRAFGLLPFVKSFRSDDLIASLSGAGFDLETVWRPSKKAAVFVIARKPEG